MGAFCGGDHSPRYRGVDGPQALLKWQSFLKPKGFSFATKSSKTWMIFGLYIATLKSQNIFLTRHARARKPGKSWNGTGTVIQDILSWDYGQPSTRKRENLSDAAVCCHGRLMGSRKWK